MSQDASKQPKHLKHSEPSNQPAAVPVKIHKKQVISTFKQYEDEEFEPIEGCNGDYYISNYGRVVSCRTSNPREIYGFGISKEKPETHKITLVRPGGVKVYHLTRLVYSHFCGELQPDQEVVILDKAYHLFYYKNLKAVSVPSTDKLSKQIAAKIPVEQAILNFKKYEDEEFKPIEGCNGGYYISNYGRVVSFKRSQAKEIFGYKVLKDKWKRRQINLVQTGGPRRYFLAHLVYSHFCGELKPSMNVIILEKNHHPFYYKNLKAVPRAKSHYSISAGYLKKLRSEITWNIPILQFDRLGRFLREYPGVEQAAAALEIQPLNLYKCLRGKRMTTGGFQWRYKTDPNFDEGICDIPPFSTTGKTVYQFSLEGTFIRSFPSIATAVRETGERRQYIGMSISGRYKKNKYPFQYQWRFAHDPLFKKGIVALTPVNKKFNLFSQPVVQFTIEGDYVEQYASIYEAAERTGISLFSIWECLRGVHKCAGKYRWHLLEEVSRAGKIEKLPMLEYKNICQFDRDGKFLREYGVLSDAARSVGVSRTAIYLCIKGLSKSAAGFQWRAKKQVCKNGKIIDIEPYSKPSLLKVRPVCQFDLEGKFIREYASIKEASQTTGINNNNISICASGKSKRAEGYQWRYRNDPIFKNGISDIPPIRKKRKGEKTSK